MNRKSRCGAAFHMLAWFLVPACSFVGDRQCAGRNSLGFRKTWIWIWVCRFLCCACSLDGVAPSPYTSALLAVYVLLKSCYRMVVGFHLYSDRNGQHPCCVLLPLNKLRVLTAGLIPYQNSQMTDAHLLNINNIEGTWNLPIYSLRFYFLCYFIFLWY